MATSLFDLDALTRKCDAEARACLMSQRGLGAWSAQYVLVRGLGRPDCLPSDDVGLRRAVGEYFARGRQLSPERLERALLPSRLSEDLRHSVSRWRAAQPRGSGPGPGPSIMHPDRSTLRLFRLCHTMGWRMWPSNTRFNSGSAMPKKRSNPRTPGREQTQAR